MILAGTGKLTPSETTGMVTPFRPSRKGDGHIATLGDDGHSYTLPLPPFRRPQGVAMQQHHRHHLDPFRLDRRPLVAVDWSMKGVHAVFDGSTVQEFATVGEAMEGRPPHRIALEATFESFDLDARLQALGRLRADGHEVYGIRPLNTARYRNWLDLPKTDAIDAVVIWRMAVDVKRHFSPLRPGVDPTFGELMDGLRAEFMDVRRRGDKPTLAAEARTYLTPWKDLPDDLRLAAGASGYTDSLAAAVLFLATRTSGRKEFEQAAGLHGSAYPTIFRSELMHHSFRHGKKRGAHSTDFRRLVRKMRAEIIEAHPRSTP